MNEHIHKNDFVRFPWWVAMLYMHIVLQFEV